MKITRPVFLLFAVATTAFAATIPDDTRAIILNEDNTNDGLGNYRYSFDTSNGIKRYETGQIENANQPNEHIVIEGNYSYSDPEGNLVTVRYRADENGFHILPSIPHPIIISLPPSAVASLLGK